MKMFKASKEKKSSSVNAKEALSAPISLTFEELEVAAVIVAGGRTTVCGGYGNNPTEGGGGAAHTGAQSVRSAE